MKLISSFHPAAPSWVHHIAGCNCYKDGTVRHWQVATSQWTPGKNSYKTGGFGPWMVTSDEIAAGQVMRLQAVLNGQVLQDSTSDKMIHSIPRQMVYICTFIPLSPGDVCEIVVDAIAMTTMA